MDRIDQIELYLSAIQLQIADAMRLLAKHHEIPTDDILREIDENRSRFAASDPDLPEPCRGGHSSGFGPGLPPA